MADLLAENGFTNFTTQDAAGNAGTAAAPQASVTAATNTSSQSNDTSAADAAATVVSCSGAAVNSTAADAGSNTNSTGTGNAGANTGAGTDTGAEDFGSCDPTMSFEGGRNGRPGTRPHPPPYPPLTNLPTHSHRIHLPIQRSCNCSKPARSSKSKHHHQPHLR